MTKLQKILQPYSSVYQHLTFNLVSSASYTHPHIQYIVYAHTLILKQAACASRRAEPPWKQGQTSDRGLGLKGRATSCFKIAVCFLRRTQLCNSLTLQGERTTTGMLNICNSDSKGRDLKKPFLSVSSSTLSALSPLQNVCCSTEVTTASVSLTTFTGNSSVRQYFHNIAFFLLECI